MARINEHKREPLIRILSNNYVVTYCKTVISFQKTWVMPNLTRLFLGSPKRIYLSNMPKWSSKFTAVLLGVNCKCQKGHHQKLA